MNKKIELTPQELEDIKDEAKYKALVIFELKQLRGIPKKVTKLEIYVGILWMVFLGYLGKVCYATMVK